MPKLNGKQDRCDASGRAYAGSQRQIQFFVNEQPKRLEQAISNVLQRPFPLRWVSPLRENKYKEYRDYRFLDALGIGRFKKDLASFWPKGGPQWDALACVEDGTEGVLLLEAKSHVPEVRGGGCAATSDSSLRQIDAAIKLARTWLQADSPLDWKGPLYQTANRIAHLYFFREILGVEAWLVNVYFVDDPHSTTSRRDWDLGLAVAKKDLGVAAIPFCVNVFLRAEG